MPKKKYRYFIYPVFKNENMGTTIITYRDLKSAVNWLAEHKSYNKDFRYVCEQYCANTNEWTYIGESEYKEL